MDPKLCETISHLRKKKKLNHQTENEITKLTVDLQEQLFPRFTVEDQRDIDDFLLGYQHVAPPDWVRSIHGLDSGKILRYVALRAVTSANTLHHERALAEARIAELNFQLALAEARIAELESSKTPMVHTECQSPVSVKIEVMDKVTDKVTRAFAIAAKAAFADKGSR